MYEMQDMMERVQDAGFARDETYENSFSNTAAVRKLQEQQVEMHDMVSRHK